MNQVPFAPEIDSSTAVGHTRPARRQHGKGHLRLFHEMLVHLLPACTITQHKLSLFRAHGHLRRLSHILMPAVPAKGTCVANAVPLNPGPISTKGTRASCAFPIGHGPSLATGTRANSAVPLSRGINSATGGRVSNAPPVNHGWGACASGAAPPATRRAAMRMLRRRVALLSERVHPLLFLTRWRSV